MSPRLASLPLLLIASTTAVAGNPPAYPRPDLLLQPAALAKPETARKFRVLDVRARAKYDAGQAPGADRPPRAPGDDGPAARGPEGEALVDPRRALRGRILRRHEAGEARRRDPGGGAPGMVRGARQQAALQGRGGAREAVQGSG